MRLKLLFFAGLRDLMGTPETKFEHPSALTVGALRSELSARHEQMRFDGVRVAVNHEFVGDEARLVDGDEVAFIPPVSGG